MYADFVFALGKTNKDHIFCCDVGACTYSFVLFFLHYTAHEVSHIITIGSCWLCIQRFIQDAVLFKQIGRKSSCTIFVFD